jgi:hypothetical protein
MDCVMECPDCGVRREASPRYFHEYVKKRASGRCRSCSNRGPKVNRSGPFAGQPASKQRPALPGQPVCVHCNYSAANRPRGLCWRCYYLPGVKELHPSNSKYARRGVGNDTPRSPCEPTDALPGTTQKLAVLERRAALGQLMFHPRDARHPDGGGPPLDLGRVFAAVNPCERDEESA